MEITIKGEPKEIAALVLEIQERQKETFKIDDPAGLCINSEE